MNRRVAFVVACVVLAGGAPLEAQGGTTPINFRRSSGSTVCNYSVPEMCHGTAWSADLTLGDFDARAVVNGLRSFRTNRDDRYSASARVTMSRTYALAQATPRVRVWVIVDLAAIEPTDLPASPQRGMGLLQSISLQAMHAGAASAGATCSVGQDDWSRDREINGFEPSPPPGYILEGVISCVDASAQPVDVPPGPIDIAFSVFTGSTLPVCVSSNGPRCLHEPPPELDMEDSRMRGRARLRVDA